MRARRAAVLAATALVGLLVAHELDYRLIVPDPTHRHDLLLRTGHGYLSRALFLAAAAAVIAAFSAVADGIARARENRGRDHVHRLSLVLVQSGAFVLLEALERAIVGAPVDGRVAVLVCVGIAVQIAIAFAGAAVLSLLERVAHAVARTLMRAPSVPRARQTLGTAPRKEHRSVCAARTEPIRGPPLPVAG